MQTMQGRTYSKTIIQQGSFDTGPVPLQLVVSKIQDLPWKSTFIRRIGDPTSAPVNAGGPVPFSLTVKSGPGLPWTSLFINRIGDPSAVPVGPITAPLITTLVKPGLPWTSLCINRIGDPTAAPANPTTTPPLVYSPIYQQAGQSKILLLAGAADFSFSGPLISTPIPQKNYVPFIGLLAPRDTSNITTTTAAPVIVSEPIQSPQRFRPLIGQAPPPVVSSSTTATPVVVSNFIQPQRLFKSLIAQVFTPFTGPSEAFGATLPTFVIGITRRTAVMADTLRTTLAKGVTLDRGPQRTVGITRSTTTTRQSLRSTLTSYVTRLTSSIFNGRSTKVK